MRVLFLSKKNLLKQERMFATLYVSNCRHLRTTNEGATHMNNRHASNDESTEERVIMLADGQSFYASVEKSDHPEYANRPLIVAGDPARRSGIVLAACPLAKRFGITTAERLGEALAKCPDVVVVQPRMEHYIAVSLQITRILRNYTDLVEPYGIDEQFLDVTGSQRMFGDPITIARQIQKQVLIETGIYTRIGISFCKVASKMACDNFAKKNDDGVFWLTAAQIQNTLWPLPVQNMFMIGSRMKRHLYRMGIHTIGDLAKTPLARLKNRWGINGEVIWQIANAHDPSPVSPNTYDHQKSFGQQMTLPRDYSQQEEIAEIGRAHV